MRLREGNMWDHVQGAQLVCVTTNAVVHGGRLVMGAGVALEAAQRFPDLPVLAGEAVRAGGLFYGLRVVRPLLAPYDIGLFQTKINWRSPSTLELVEGGVRALAELVEARGLTDVHLPYPGIGRGGLAPAAVGPLLEGLSDSVTIWQFPPLPSPRR